MDVITTVLILMEAIIVFVWMDMNWNQIITLVQVMLMCMHAHTYMHIHTVVSAKLIAILYVCKYTVPMFALIYGTAQMQVRTCARVSSTVLYCTVLSLSINCASA